MFHYFLQELATLYNSIRTRCTGLFIYKLVHPVLNLTIEPRSWRGVLDTPLYDKVCQSLSTGRWFSPGTPVSSDNHDVTELLLKVAFNTINQPQTYNSILD